MKHWEKTEKIKIDPFNRNIEFVYTNNISKSRNDRSEKLGILSKQLDSNIDGICCENGYNITLFVSNKASIGVIAHEAYHAVLAIFRYIGVDQYDEEITAYHLGYIVDEMYKIMKK